jgi:hypothetical protein
MAMKGGGEGSGENMGPVMMKIESFQIQLDEINERMGQLVNDFNLRLTKTSSILSEKPSKTLLSNSILLHLKLSLKKYRRQTEK